MLKLQAVELSKSYRGRKVVDDVELEIGQGEVVGLLGPNGAGKTTTFYIIVGLARPDSGRVLLNGDEITDLPMYLRARSGISYLPQEPSVFRQLTSEENLLAVLETLAAHAGAAARSFGGIAGADGARNCKTKQGLHAFRWRTPPPGNRAVAYPAALLHPARRAFFRHRSFDREGSCRRSSES